MSQLTDRLNDMLEPAVLALGFELVGVEFVRAGKHSTLRVYIDHENGISVDDCADVSNQVSAVLDVEDPINTEYNLEVSSPGLERPLFKQSHFAAFVGQEIVVKTNMPQQNRRNFKGVLTHVDGQSITMSVDKQDYVIALANISKANVVPNYDEL